MRVAIINPDALSRSYRRLVALGEGPTADDLKRLGDDWRRIIAEDNRKGVLSGTDGAGKTAPPLRYRLGTGWPTKARTGQAKGFRVSRRKGFAPRRGKTLPNNNLTTEQYMKLSGPRLAPRGDASRVIANHATESIIRSTGKGLMLEVVGSWVDVVSAKGKPFLAAHFRGRGRLPKYDLRGIRRWGLGQARNAAMSWLRILIRTRLGR